MQLLTSNQRYGWIVTILSGLFMFVSLYVYRAYHIDQVAAFTGDSILFRAIVHALIISAVFFVVEFFLAPKVKMQEKIKPLVTAILATLIGLHLTFLAFNYFFHWTEMYWSSYLQFLYEYPLIIVTPVTLSYLIDNLIKTKSSNELITFSSENGKEHFQLKPEYLLYIKSADNYVEIVYQNKDQVLKRLIRKKLTSIEEAFQANEALTRCHRSYLINRINIDHIHKSSNKIELSINGEIIPVSKKYEHHFIS